MNNSFSFSFHENTPSWLESYYYQINDAAATKKRLQSERAKHSSEKRFDTSLSEEDFDNSLYETFFSADKVKHTRLVCKAAVRHWRHKDINQMEESSELNRDPRASYQNLRDVLSGHGPTLLKDVSQEKTVPDMKLFDQSLLASEVRARAGLARIINADQSQFERLADDISSDVRMGVLQNQKCPAHVLRRLSEDPNQDVALAARQRLGLI